MMTPAHPVQVGDYSLSVRRCGSGRPALLIHGFPLDSRLWLELLASCPEGFELIAPDLPGFGTSQPPMSAEKMTMSDYAKILWQLVDQIAPGASVVPIGLSMGGYIQIEMIKQAANRIPASVFCHTRAAADTELVARGRLQQAISVLEQGPDTLFETMLPKLMARPGTANDAKNRQLVLKMMQSSSPLAISQAQRGMAERTDHRDLLSTLQGKHLVIAGSEDQITPPDEMKTMSSAIHDSEFSVIDGVGHLSPIEAPDTFAKLVCEFLRRV
ncbi:MAG: alpha/beta hydrolase [Pirellulaceae bacterium]